MEKAGCWKGYVSYVRITYTVIINQRAIQRWGSGSREDLERHREMQSALFMSVRGEHGQKRAWTYNFA